MLDDRCAVCGMTVRLRLIDLDSKVLEDVGYPCDCTKDICTCSMEEQCFNCREKDRKGGLE